MGRATPWPFILCPIVLLASPWPADAQPAAPDPLVPVRSLGKPPVFKPFMGGYYGLDSTEDEKKSGGGAFFGVYKDLLPSIVGCGVSGEGYVGGYPGVTGVDGGVRALARTALVPPQGRRRLRLSPRGHVLHPVSHRASAARGDPGSRHPLPRRLAARTRQLVELRPAAPARAAHGKDAARAHGHPAAAGEEAGGAALAPPVAAAMGEVRTAARHATVLNAMFWRDHRSDRLKSLETSRAEMRDFKSWLGRTEPPAPAGRAHGERGPDPPRSARPCLRARGGRLGRGREDAGRSPLAAMAREVVLDEVIYPYNRLFGQYKKPEELWGLAAEGAGALCREARRIRDAGEGAPQRAWSSRTTFGPSRSCGTWG